MRSQDKTSSRTATAAGCPWRPCWRTLCTAKHARPQAGPGSGRRPDAFQTHGCPGTPFEVGRPDVHGTMLEPFRFSRAEDPVPVFSCYTRPGAQERRPGVLSVAPQRPGAAYCRRPPLWWSALQRRPLAKTAAGCFGDVAMPNSRGWLSDSTACPSSDLPWPAKARQRRRTVGTALSCLGCLMQSGSLCSPAQPHLPGMLK